LLKETPGPLMELEPTTSTLRARRATHCATPPLDKTTMEVEPRKLLLY